MLAIVSAVAAVAEALERSLEVEVRLVLLVLLALAVRLVVRPVVLHLVLRLDRTLVVGLAAVVVDACRLGGQEFAECRSLLAHRLHLGSPAG